MVSPNCDGRCATYNEIHVCYSRRFLPERTGPLYEGFYEVEIPVTVKTIRKCPENENFFGELPFLNNNSYQTPYLVKYYCKEETASLRIVAMERCETNLRNLQNIMLSKSQRLEMIKSVCFGVNILHTKFRIVHRDINPSNVLMKKSSDGRYTAILADSGISKKISDNNHTPAVTGYGTRESFSLFKLFPSGLN